MKILLAYFRLPSVRTAGLLYFLMAGALTQVPLFNYLGYEFSAVMTIPAAFISGLLTISFIQIHAHQPISRRKFLLVISHYYIVNGVLLLIPLVVMSMNAFAVKNCSFTRGLLYFALLPLCSMIFSVSLALAVGILFRRARLFFCAFVVLILSHIVFVTYTQPQLFAYNFILGYFPGITYDESLNSISSLALYREFTLIASLLFVIIFFLSVRMVWWDFKFHENIQLVKRRKGDIILYGAAVLCFVILLCGHFESGPLGFQYSAADIQEELGGRASTAHFILFYPEKLVSIQEVQLLKAEAEYHYTVDIARMEEALRSGEKIIVYLYPTGDSKRRFIGTATTNIAKPWRKEIHLTLDSFDGTFRHELVHVLASNVGIPVICASTRMGLNEGFAVAVDWNWENFSPHQYAAALQRDKLLGDPAELFTYTGFAAQQSSYAYVVAGSFSRYLIDRFGVKRFKEVFPTGHFVEVYGLSLNTLVNEWEEFLRTVDVSALPSETVKTLFAQQSIFRKTCARVTAERNSKAVEAIHVKNYQDAENEFSASFDDARTPFALRGLFQALMNQGKNLQVIEQYNGLDPHSMLRYNPGILFLFGDALWLRGNVLEALAVYRHVEEMNYSRAFSEAAAVRRLIVRDPRTNNAFREYFYGHASDSLRDEILQQLSGFNESRPVAEYLKAEELFRSKRYHEAGKMFSSLAAAFQDQDLSLACLMNAGECYYHSQEFEQAKSMYWEAQNYTHSAAMLMHLKEWIERCDIIGEDIS